MPKPTDIRILSTATQSQFYKLRTPMKFGGRVITELTVLEVTAAVETRSGQRAEGHGSMPVGNAWGWPSQLCSSDQTLAAMVALGQQLADQAGHYPEYGHPLEITCDLAREQPATANAVVTAAGLKEPMPRLAQLVAASPLEAALHDAYGKALGQNSYNVLGSEFANRDLSAYLSEEFRGEYLDRYTLRTPKASLPLYHLIGALDPLTDVELKERVGDGLPETLRDWIVADRLTHFKIKLAGNDLKWDIQRMLAVERVVAQVQQERSCSSWRYSGDFNEKCPNVDYVLDFLNTLAKRSPASFHRLQYLEQPMSRALHVAGGERMHRASQIKPIVIDESLVDFAALVLARELGYSGVALKTCKGHSEALLMAAAAQKYGMFLCVQDLTCPGASFLHSAGLASRIAPVAAIEGNARQYCPAGNRGWDARFPGIFRLTDGTVGTAVLDGPGLGF